MQQSWHFSPVCHCLRPLRLALLASSPKGGAKGRLIAARLFPLWGNNVGALRRQCGVEYLQIKFGGIVYQTWYIGNIGAKVGV